MKLNEVKALGPVDFYTKLQTSSSKDKKVVINFRAVPFDKKCPHWDNKIIWPKALG